MKSVCLETLGKRWGSTCRVLLREEVGSLQEFVPWLRRYNEPMLQRVSSVSGKEVTFAVTNYAENSKWMSFDEVDFGRKFEPLSINEIKDLDSLVSALQERIYYTGSVVLGNSGEVEKSSNVSDSFYMYETGKLTDCKYVAYSTLGRLDEDCFGCNGIGESQHCIKCHETFRDKRCLELWMGQNCSDCYYSHQLAGCSDCMFCFDVKNKRHAIGNLQLDAAKYRQVKEKLLAEMAELLRREKKLPSLIDIVGKSRFEKPSVVPRRQAEEKTGLAPIEEAFQRTAQLLLGKRLPGKIDDYAVWLMKNVRRQESHPSAISGRMVYRWDYASYFHLPKERLIKFGESLQFGEQMTLGEKEALEISLQNAHEAIGRIAFFTTEYEEGKNTNVIECPTPTDTANAYRCSPIVFSKYCAYSFWPRSTEHAFGCGALLSSEFCINCYHSVKLKRCFEMESCRDCSDSYFCHSCENVRDSAFCFNAKNLRYAIGNAEIGRERFLEAKERILGWLLAELERKQRLKLDIYNVGTGGKK